MNVVRRLTEYHAKSRPSFILFVEFAALAGSMFAIVGIGFLRDYL